MKIPGTSSQPATPKSDAALERFAEFTGRVHERLVNGKRVYGDGSFERDPKALVEEIRQEVLDVAGWAFILYQRLSEMESVLSGHSQIANHAIGSAHEQNVFNGSGNARATHCDIDPLGAD